MLGTQKRPAATTVTNPTTAAPTRPIRRLEDHALYREEVAKLSDLERERSEVQERLAEIRSHRRHGETNLEAQARDLLDGVGRSSTPVWGMVLATGEHEQLLRKERLLDMAIKLQKERVIAAYLEAGREIGRAALPEYQKILERLAAALIEAGKIADEEEDFRAELQRNGMQGGFVGMPFHDVQLRSGGSKLNRWLDELKGHYGVEVKVRRGTGGESKRLPPR